MRTIKVTAYKFAELSKEAQNKVINDHIQCMIEYEHEDHYNNWPEYKKAADKCEAMQTPWFLGEYIFEACGKEIIESLSSLDSGYEYTKEGEII